MKPVIAVEAEYVRMPYWITSDKQELILKVKDKFIGTIEPYEQGKLYSINAVFRSYCIEKDNEAPINCYFLKVPYMKPCCMLIESD